MIVPFRFTTSGIPFPLSINDIMTVLRILCGTDENYTKRGDFNGI